MADTLICEIVTPVKTVFSSEATYVRLPGEGGSFGVMQRHEPLVSALQPGVVDVTASAAGKDGKTSYIISGGYAQVSDNKVIVLANDALDIEDIDTNAVRAELSKVEQDLAACKDDDSSAAYFKAQKAWLDLQLKSVTA